MPTKEMPHACWQKDCDDVVSCSFTAAAICLSPPGCSGHFKCCQACCSPSLPRLKDSINIIPVEVHRYHFGTRALQPDPGPPGGQ